MVPRRQAAFYLARHDDRPIAGALYFLSGDRMSCVHEASARAPELVPLQGPTAIIWHAMRAARAASVPCFDLGVVTPARTADDSGLWGFPFKREFGGMLEAVHHGMVRLSRRALPMPKLLQPAWQRLVALRPRVGAA